MRHLYHLALAGALLLSPAIKADAYDLNAKGSDFFTSTQSKGSKLLKRSAKKMKINKEDRFKKHSAELSHRHPAMAESRAMDMRKAEKAKATTLNLKAIYDEEASALVCVAAYDYDGLVEEWFYAEEPGTKEGEIKVPSSNRYVVLAFFTNFDENGYETYPSYVVLDNVEATKSSMDLTLDLSTATNVISAEGCYPDGDPFRVEKLALEDTEEGPEFVTVEEGNVDLLTVRGGIYHKQIGELFWAQVTASSDFVDSPDYPDFAEPTASERSLMHINDLGDDFIVTMTITATRPDESPCYVDLRKEGTATEKLTNAAADYVDVINIMKESQLALRGKYPASDKPFSVNTMHYIGGKEVEGLSLDGGNLLEKVLYCNAPEKYRSIDYRTGIQPWREDLVTYYSCDTTYDGEWMIISEERTSTNNIAPTVVINADNSPLIMAMANPVFYEHTHDAGTLEDKVHVLFRQTAKQRLYPLGSGTVYSSNLVFTNPKEGGLNPFDVEYFGMCQEICGAYSSASTPTIFYNGEKVDYDYEYYSDFWSGGFFGWCYDWNAEKHPEGSYDITFLSPNYVANCDTEGTLMTNFRFDQTKEDDVPPAVQYVQLRDKNDCITNVLSTPEDGVLRIVAGDFKATYDCYCEESMYPQYNGKEECIPAVSYHYFGDMTEGWSHLNVEKEMDAYGYFAPCYKVDLSEMLIHSDIQPVDGWVEIAISMRDSSGNEMSQSLSPLFKIDSFSGVKTFTATGVSARVANRTLTVNGADCPAVEVYSVSGRHMLSSKGNSISLAALAPGTYVATIGEGSAKTNLKFVIF